MSTKYEQNIRKTLNTDAKLHLTTLKHTDHISEQPLLDDKIKQKTASIVIYKTQSHS